MDHYGHLFRSDSHRRAMDAIAETIDSPCRAARKCAPEMVGLRPLIATKRWCSQNLYEA